MSWKASAWAKETMGHHSYAQKLLLMMLAEYHNPELDIAFPSVRELARVSEMPERTVRHCIKGLETMGFISTIQKGNQYQRTEYRLHFATAQAYDAAMNGAARVAGADEGAKDSIVKRQKPASEAATPRHTNRQEPLLESTVSLIEREPPEWYLTLKELPGFAITLDHAQQWLDRNGIGEDRANETALALKSKWPPSKQHKDVWSTFQGWVKRPPLPSRNGRRSSRTEIELPPAGEAFRFFKDPEHAETD